MWGQNIDDPLEYLENDILDSISVTMNQLGKNILSPALHLDSPITNTRWQEYILNPLPTRLSQAWAFKEVVELNYNCLFHDIINRSHARFYGDFFSKLWNKELVQLHPPKIPFKKCLHHSVSNLLIQERVSLISRSSKDMLSCKQAIDVLNSDTILSELYSWMALVSDLVKLQATMISKLKVPIENCNSSVLFTTLTTAEDLTVIFADVQSKMFLILGPENIKIRLDNTTYVLTREMFLGWSDLIHERFMVLMTLKLMEQISRIDYPSVMVVQKAFQIGDLTLLEEGNLAYDSIKFWEPACVARILEIGQDNIIDSTPFIQHTYNSIPNKKYRNALYGLLTSMDDLNWMSQLFGLYRLWGHPLVMTDAGLMKVQTKAFEHKQINKEIVQDTVRMFKHLYITGFIRKHKRWPNITLCSFCTLSPYLSHCIQSRQKPKLTDSRLRLKDYDSLILSKQFSVDSSFNLTSFLSDKALSLQKNKVIELVKCNKGIGSSHERKVLINWIQSEYVSAQQILDYVSSYGFSVNDLIIGVVPKEREMKVAPRMFALLTLLARLYFVITEDMISSTLLPLFPQITMKDSGLELTKRLLKLTRGQSLSNSALIYIILNIDFEKWNTNMRGEFVTPLFECIDNVFGLSNVVAFTHKFFESSTIYLATPEACHEPGILNDLNLGKWAWRGHMGGLEGLRQKGWTIATVCLLELAAYTNYLSHELIGQGDNQVLVLKIPRPDPLNPWIQDLGYLTPEALVSSRLQKFERTLYDLTLAVGLPIKEEETWKSTSLAAYGKVLFYKGRPLPMSLKRISRMFPLANEEFPSIDNDLATVFNAGVAATQYDYDHTAGFFGASFWIIWILESSLKFHLSICGKFEDIMFGRRQMRSAHMNMETLFTWPSYTVESKTHSLTRALYRKSTEQNLNYLIWIVTLRPKILGGYSIQHLPGFWAKGFPDPLTASLSFLKLIYFTMIENHGHIYTIIKESIKKIFDLRLSSEIQPLHLLQDPVSINLDIPPIGKQLLRNFVQTTIKAIKPLNPQVEDLLKHYDGDLSKLATALYALNPFPAFLLSDILDATIPGYTSLFFSKFEKTSTLLSGTAVHHGKQMKETCVRAELRYFAEQVRCSLQSGVEPPPGCTVDWAEHLRFEGWKKKIEGVTVPFPLETVNLEWITETGCKTCKIEPTGDFIKVSFDYRLQDDKKIFWSKLGPNIPYLGSETHEKVSTIGGGRLENSDPLVTRAARLQRTVGWFILKNSPAHTLINNVWKAVSNMPVERLEASESTSTGSSHHRYSTFRNVRSGTYVPQYTPISFLQVTTSTLWSYAGKSTNTTIHFQYFINQVQGIVAANLVNCQMFNTVSGAHFHIKCHQCIREIQEDHYEGSIEWKNVKIPSVPNSHFLWVDQSKLSFREDIEFFDSFEALQPLCIKESHRKIIAHYLVAWESSSLLLKDVDHLPSDQGLAISWLSKLDPVLYLEMVSLVLYIRFLGSLVKTTQIVNSKINDIARSLLEEWLWETPSSKFAVLSPLFFTKSNRQELLRSEYRIAGFNSFPPTDSSSGSAVRKALMTIFASISQIKDRCIYDDNYKVLSFPWRPIHSIKDPGCFWTILRLMIVHKNIDYIEDLREISENTDNALNQALAGTPDPFLTSNLHIQVKTLSYKLVRAFPRDLASSTDWLIKSLSSRKAFIYKAIPFKQTTLKQTTYLHFHEVNRLLKLLIFDRSTTIKIEHIIHHTKEYSSHMYRIPLGITSAWQKLYEVCCTHIESLNVCFIVGDGTGGISGLIKRLTNEKATVYYNTLFSLSNSLPQALSELVPPSLEMYSLNNTTVQNNRTLGEEISNLTNPNFYSFWEVKISSLISCIISDAEFGFNHHESSYLGLIQLLKLCLVKGESTMLLLFKTYMDNIHHLCLLLHLCTGVFMTVSIIRSHFSNQTGQEIYICCKNIKSDAYLDTSTVFRNASILGFKIIDDLNIAGSGILNLLTPHFLLWDSAIEIRYIGEKLFDRKLQIKDLFNLIGLGWTNILLESSTKDRVKKGLIYWTKRMRWYSPFFFCVHERKKAQSHEYFPHERIHLDVIGLLTVLMSLHNDSSAIRRNLVNLISTGLYFIAFTENNVLKAIVSSSPEIYIAPGTTIRQTDSSYTLKLFQGSDCHIQKILYKAVGLMCHLELTLTLPCISNIRLVKSKQEGYWIESSTLFLAIDWRQLTQSITTQQLKLVTPVCMSRWISKVPAATELTLV